MTRAHSPRFQSYYDDPDAPPVARTLAERTAHQVAVAVPTDGDLGWLRPLVYDLRPDCADPASPPVREAIAPGGTPRTPAAPWDRSPASLGDNTAAVLASLQGAARGAPEVMARLATLPPDAAAVLRWLRDHARLAEGSRGVLVALGKHFASAVQSALWAHDLTARRAGSYAHGRTLALGAERAWWKR